MLLLRPLWPQMFAMCGTSRFHSHFRFIHFGIFALAFHGRDLKIIAEGLKFCR